MSIFGSIAQIFKAKRTVAAIAAVTVAITPAVGNLALPEAAHAATEPGMPSGIKKDAFGNITHRDWPAYNYAIERKADGQYKFGTNMRQVETIDYESTTGIYDSDGLGKGWKWDDNRGQVSDTSALARSNYVPNGRSGPDRNQPMGGFIAGNNISGFDNSCKASKVKFSDGNTPVTFIRGFENAILAHPDGQYEHYFHMYKTGDSIPATGSGQPNDVNDVEGKYRTILLPQSAGAPSKKVGHLAEDISWYIDANGAPRDLFAADQAANLPGIPDPSNVPVAYPKYSGKADGIDLCGGGHLFLNVPVWLPASSISGSGKNYRRGWAAAQIVFADGRTIYMGLFSTGSDIDKLESFDNLKKKDADSTVPNTTVAPENIKIEEGVGIKKDVSKLELTNEDGSKVQLPFVGNGNSATQTNPKQYLERKFAGYYTVNPDGTLKESAPVPLTPNADKGYDIPDGINVSADDVVTVSPSAPVQHKVFVEDFLIDDNIKISRKIDVIVTPKWVPRDRKHDVIVANGGVFGDKNLFTFGEKTKENNPTAQPSIVSMTADGFPNGVSLSSSGAIAVNPGAIPADKDTVVNVKIKLHDPRLGSQYDQIVTYPVTLHPKSTNDSLKYDDKTGVTGDPIPGNTPQILDPDGNPDTNAATKLGSNIEYELDTTGAKFTPEGGAQTDAPAGIASIDPATGVVTLGKTDPAQVHAGVYEIPVQVKGHPEVKGVAKFILKAGPTFGTATGGKDGNGSVKGVTGVPIVPVKIEINNPPANATCQLAAVDGSTTVDANGFNADGLKAELVEENGKKFCQISGTPNKEISDKTPELKLIDGNNTPIPGAKTTVFEHVELSTADKVKANPIKLITPKDTPLSLAPEFTAKNGDPLNAQPTVQTLTINPGSSAAGLLADGAKAKENATAVEKGNATATVTFEDGSSLKDVPIEYNVYVGPSYDPQSIPAVVPAGGITITPKEPVQGGHCVKNVPDTDPWAQFITVNPDCSIKITGRPDGDVPFPPNVVSFIPDGKTEGTPVNTPITVDPRPTFGDKTGGKDNAGKIDQFVNTPVDPAVKITVKNPAPNLTCELEQPYPAGLTATYDDATNTCSIGGTPTVPTNGATDVKVKLKTKDGTDFGSTTVSVNVKPKLPAYPANTDIPLVVTSPIEINSTTTPDGGTCKPNTAALGEWAAFVTVDPTSCKITINGRPKTNVPFPANPVLFTPNNGGADVEIPAGITPARIPTFGTPTGGDDANNAGVVSGYTNVPLKTPVRVEVTDMPAGGQCKLESSAGGGDAADDGLHVATVTDNGKTYCEITGTPNKPINKDNVKLIITKDGTPIPGAEAPVKEHVVLSTADSVNASKVLIVTPQGTAKEQKPEFTAKDGMPALTNQPHIASVEFKTPADGLSGNGENVKEAATTADETDGTATITFDDGSKIDVPVHSNVYVAPAYPATTIPVEGGTIAPVVPVTGGTCSLNQGALGDWAPFIQVDPNTCVITVLPHPGLDKPFPANPVTFTPNGGVAQEVPVDVTVPKFGAPEGGDPAHPGEVTGVAGSPIKDVKIPITGAPAGAVCHAPALEAVGLHVELVEENGQKYCKISGTPTKAVNGPFDVTVTDGNGKVYAKTSVPGSIRPIKDELDPKYSPTPIIRGTEGGPFAPSYDKPVSAGVSYELVDPKNPSNAPNGVTLPPGGVLPVDGGISVDPKTGAITVSPKVPAGNYLVPVLVKYNPNDPTDAEIVMVPIVVNPNMADGVGAAADKVTGVHGSETLADPKFQDADGKPSANLPDGATIAPAGDAEGSEFVGKVTYDPKTGKVKIGADAPIGKGSLKVKIKFPDGSEKIVTIPFEITPAPAMFGSPSGGDTAHVGDLDGTVGDGINPILIPLDGDVPSDAACRSNGGALEDAGLQVELIEQGGKKFCKISGTPTKPVKGPFQIELYSKNDPKKVYASVTVKGEIKDKAVALPFTGSDLLSILPIGFALFGMGIVALAFRRRRRS